MKAVFVHSNAYDVVLLENGTVLEVDQYVFGDFINEPEFGNWHGNENWDDQYRTIREAAENYGDIVAYYSNDNKLIVYNESRWNERKEFYLGR